MKKYIFPIIAILALIVSLGSLVGGKTNQSLVAGGVTNYDTLGVNGLKVGSGCNDSNNTCTGTSFTHFIGTTGDVIRTDASQSASTTAPYDIAVTSALTTDNVIAQFASTTSGFTSNQYGTGASMIFPTGWVITSAHASSTAGFVTVMIMNNTGKSAALINSFGIASSTNVWLFK